jgi:hypothetical protein
MLDLTPVTQAAVTAAAGLVGALATALLAMLPRLWTMARVYVDGSDATRLRFAVANAAEVALRAVEGGQPQDRAVDDMVGYCQASLPRALARLGTTPETLRTMCEAALARLMAGRA